MTLADVGGVAMRGESYQARRSVDLSTSPTGEFHLRRQREDCEVIGFGGKIDGMSHPPRARSSQKPLVAPTAETICEMIAYMQRERHLIRHLVERMDSLERELRQLSGQRLLRGEWQRLTQKVDSLRDEVRSLSQRPVHSPSK
jgi:polyhydroxyalkanoate synthesis regulator phasin